MRKWIAAFVFSIALLGATIPAHAGNDELRGHKIKHVLLISIDGLHALDVANYVAAHPNSAMAALSSHGVTFSNARTPANSDSFPGLLALVTGGSPISHGLFYDVSYDRTIYDPTNVTCSGPAGNMMVFDESIDLYNAHNVSQNVIDPAKLPRVRDKFGNCVALYPHSALRTNTIFEAAKSKGWHTAWADKHPAYDLVNGPSGTGVDDLYTPEVTNVGGLDNTKTRKYWNVKATGRASLVVDDLASVDPWRPRMVKVTGTATIGTDDRGKPTIRIRPETVWSFGLGDGERPGGFGQMKREV